MNIKTGLLLVVLLGACGKKQDAPGGTGSGGGSAGGSAAGKTVEGKDSKDAPPAELAAWMPKGAGLAWEQNAWISRLQLRTSGTMSMAGDPVAIEIKGDKAKVFDGKDEHQLGFTIDSACTVTFTKEITEGSMKGGKQMMSKTFVMTDGKFLVGDGQVGYRKGKTAFVCGSGNWAMLDDKGECTSFTKKFREWEKSPTKCEWAQEDGKDVLKINDVKLVADGDLLLSDQFNQYVKEGYHAAAKSWDDAKTAVTALVKAKDPGEVAKTAGGTVGKTDSVASLQATYAADKKSVEGKELELTALYLNSNSSTSGGKTTYNAIVVDKKGEMKVTLTCNLDAEVKDLKQYDKVKVKGIVGESFSQAALDKCTLAKAK